MREEPACPAPPAGHSLLMARLAAQAEARALPPPPVPPQVGKLSLTMSVTESALEDARGYQSTSRWGLRQGFRFGIENCFRLIS